ncbi:MAG TPA: class I SAM-dependent methyltransferase [Terriglobia bacterium]|nr:class I SAM-dependent methyltransferase [Terriglobia bacterium]
MGSIWHPLVYPSRLPFPDDISSEDVQAFIESRTREHSGRLEDEFASRALALGVESGIVLDVGTRVGLIALKIVWQNENVVAMGLDTSGPLIERARETATAWELTERAVFQVGDPRNMRLKSAYFDLVVSDCSLHRFDNVVAVLREVGRVLKPKGAVLIRDYSRPNRLKMIGKIQQHTERLGDAMRSQVEQAIQSAYTPDEIRQAVAEAGLTGVLVDDSDQDYVVIERRGETDPGSWVTAREQYR